MIKTTDPDSSSLFIEQAEYLESDAFAAWTEGHPQEKQILQKLCRSGAKLISGPRGCGKTTLLLKAYRKLLDPGARGLPIYVNFKSSLRLEPLYKHQANAMYWFNQWMLLKCYVGLLDTIKDLDIIPSCKFRYSRAEAANLASNLELAADTSLSGTPSKLTIEHLAEDINCVLDASGRERCLLFLDDAAHAFSPEQQRDFFDFFRRIKSRKIAPKAAIYPGVTILSPSFHIGHDAEEIDVWIDPYTNDYLSFMKGLLRRRLPNDIYNAMAKSEALLDLICFGAFGMPRALLNTVREFYDVENNDSTSGFTKGFTSKAVLQAIKASYENTIGVYVSLRQKLPMYQNFIDVGEELLEESLQAVKRYNKNKSETRQSIAIAVQSPLSAELERVIGFLEYAGLVMPGKKVSRGIKGRFELFQLHSGGLIDRNALLGRKSVRADLLSKAIQARNAHEFTRITPAKLLNAEDLSSRLTLALPPCQNCGTPRPTETAKFCLQCGSPLTALSTFKTLVQCDISELPLSSTRVERIRDNSTIRTVGDILMDHERRKLRGVPWIGPYWADRIYHYAEEFIG